ncbi:MAG TPA: hypothetical protein VIX91_07955 [Candidatus Acidoferrum sp.]
MILTGGCHENVTLVVEAVEGARRMGQGQTPSVTETGDKTEGLLKGQVLRYAALVFVAALLVHGADHWRRGFKVLTPEVYWAGMALSVLAVISITLVLTRHSWGPLSAVAVGFPMAFGVAASHLLPHWSSFSDAFPGSGLDRLSYTAVIFEVLSSLLFGAAGMRTLLRPRQRGT